MSVDPALEEERLGQTTRCRRSGACRNGAAARRLSDMHRVSADKAVSPRGISKADRWRAKAIPDASPRPSPRGFRRRHLVSIWPPTTRCFFSLDISSSRRLSTIERYTMLILNQHPFPAFVPAASPSPSSSSSSSQLRSHRKNSPPQAQPPPPHREPSSQLSLLPSPGIPC
jgi:hypothetical protein